MNDPSLQANPLSSHTPPLGYAALTPLYDSAIAILTREHVWRTRFALAIAPKPNDKILDVGSGTGSLAIQLLKQSPNTNYLGIDPDIDAVARSRGKLKKAQLKAAFMQSYLTQAIAVTGGAPTKIVSSLVLHQVPLDEKRRILNIMFQSLTPAGTVHIADYGHQTSWLMKKLFRLTVQFLDGVHDTQPNADGLIPQLMTQAGFLNVEEHDRIPTVTGMISLYRGDKPKVTTRRAKRTPRKDPHHGI